jgi:hypothetical protein
MLSQCSQPPLRALLENLGSDAHEFIAFWGRRIFIPPDAQQPAYCRLVDFAALSIANNACSAYARGTID